MPRFSPIVERIKLNAIVITRRIRIPTDATVARMAADDATVAAVDAIIITTVMAGKVDVVAVAVAMEMATAATMITVTAMVTTFLALDSFPNQIGTPWILKNDDVSLMNMLALADSKSTTLS